MTKQKSILIICGSLLLVAITFYFIGYTVASSYRTNSHENEQTFYATIIEIYRDSFKVQGLAVNDINYRSEFVFTVKDETKLEWKGTEITVSDFAVNDTISITFSGVIQETYPATIIDVTRIQLLEDEM